MKKFGDFIVKNKIIILIVGVVALIPALIGMINTKINYNVLVYLPADIETMKGQQILSDDFNLGSFSISILDNMSAKDALKFEEKIKKVDGVNQVFSLYDVIGTQIPLEMLPTEVKDKVTKGDSTLLMITFRDSISDEKTMNAVKEIREITKDRAKIGGMSAMVLDTRNLADSEIAAYVVIAVICCIFVLALALDSWVVPILLLLNIGFAVLYNMGTNIFLGNISYITKAISSILQLGVTTDFSIFLYHQYEHEKKDAKNKQEAMSKAITKTLNSIVGSSTTTIAGFLALCTMQLTLGKDIGIVMAKGVVFGVISVVTIFPALLLTFDKPISKTTHKPFIPKFEWVNNFVIKRYKWIFATFLILLIPAYIGQKNTEVYYNLDKTLPSTLASSIANSELEKDYKIVSPMIILAPKSLNNNKLNEMVSSLKAMDKIDLVLSYSELSDLNIPDEMIDQNIKSIFESDKYSLILINSTYEKATNELNNQIDDINALVKGYDKKTIVAGEGALTKDLVEISNTDFNNVSYSSIIVILIIIIFVLKSYTLPIILIAAIELAIFINMAIPYYTGVTIPFISSIVIGTIQLGATIDYAILMTNKYLEKRKSGADAKTAVRHALESSVSSIFISGMCFFAATFGVGLYSDLEMVGSLCSLIARGAIISMLVVIFILPSLLIIFDKLIIKTTSGFKKGEMKMKKEIKMALIVLFSILFMPVNTYALTKEETVYVKIDNTGAVNKTIVSEHLKNADNASIKDLSYLTDIVNTNGNEEYKADGNSLTWNSNGSDIYYKGLTNKSLPISLKITYSLDGKVYNKLDTIKNAKGHVIININFTNNSKVGSLYTPFTVLLSTSLDNEANKNIKINNGEVIDNGKTSILAGIAMPGLSQSLSMSQISSLNKITISYDTTSFSTTSMYAVVTPKFLKINEVSSQINSLYTSMDKLNASSNELVAGSLKLKGGAVSLNTKYSSFNDNLNSLNEGVKALYNNYGQINGGINQIGGEISKLEPVLEMLQELNKNTQVLSNLDLTQINKEVKGLVDSLSDYQKLISDGLTSITGNVCNPNSNQYNETTCGELKDFAQKLETNKIDQTKLKELQAQIDSISAKLENTKTLAEQLNNKTNDITTKITTAKESINKLTNGSNLFNGKLGYVSTSLNTLNSYSKQINDGIKNLSEGTQVLSSGMNKFNNEGIKVLYSTINNTLKTKVNTLKELNKLSNNYNSFGGASNKTNSNTKFIIQISK